MVDCKTVEYCVTAFFDDNIDVQLRYEVVCHLLRCKKCYRIYNDYAKSEGLYFDVVREASKVQLEWQNEIPQGEAIYVTKRESEKAKEFKPPTIHKKEENDRNVMDKWTTANNMNDYSELMNIKAVREIYQEQKNTSKYEEEARLFTKFLTKKICQKIDFLEKCFNAEDGEKDA